MNPESAVWAWEGLSSKYGLNPSLLCNDRFIGLEMSIHTMDYCFRSGIATRGQHAIQLQKIKDVPFQANRLTCVSVSYYALHMCVSQISVPVLMYGMLVCVSVHYIRLL